MHDHAHSPGHTHAVDPGSAASAFAVSAGLRLGLAVACAAVMWLAVSWALGWW